MWSNCARESGFSGDENFHRHCSTLSQRRLRRIEQSRAEKIPKSHKKQLEQSAADAMDVDGEEEEEEEEERATSKKASKKGGRGAKASATDADEAEGDEADPANVKEQPVPRIRHPSAREAAAKLAVPFVGSAHPRLCHCAFKTAWQSTSGAVEGINMLFRRCSEKYHPPAHGKDSVMLTSSLARHAEARGTEIKKTSRRFSTSLLTCACQLEVFQEARTRSRALKQV